MQNDEHSPADTVDVPGSSHEKNSSRVQLSANTTLRLEKLARWRIDPSLIKFPKGALKFEGGYATVSRGLLASSIRGTHSQDQPAELNVGTLTSSNRLYKADGNKERPYMEGGEQKENIRNEVSIEREEEEPDGEILGRWKTVAIKTMRVKTPDQVVRVLGLTLREAEVLAGISHESIIKLEGFVEDVSKQMIWLVFPWEDHGTLKDFVASADWQIPERISLIYDVTSGVDYLHSREAPIVHGDLKSINVLVNSMCRAVITDFGSARQPDMKGPRKERERSVDELRQAASPEATFSPSTNTITLTFNQYTLRWAAPELLEDDDASVASDIWALGCVAMEIMTNSIPFEGVKDAVVIMRVVSGDHPSISGDARMLLIQALCSLVELCWNIDPSKRPTAEDCRKAIHWMPRIVPNPVRTANTAGFADHSPELLMILGSMHMQQDDYTKASTDFAKALDAYTNLADREGRANALLQLAQIHQLKAENDQAVTSYSDALKIYTDTGDRPGRAFALWGLAEAHRARDEHSQAVALYSQSLQIRTDIGDRRGRADALMGIAEVHRARSDYSQAVAFYTECLQLRTEIGDRHGRASALFGLAEVHRLRDEYDQAAAFYSECLKTRTEIGDRRGRADTLWGLAEVHRFRDDYSQAVTLYSECLQIRTDIGDRRGRADALWGLAEVHRVRGEYSQAVALYSECLQIRTDMGDRNTRAPALYGLAEVHRLRGEYSQAVALYFECLQIRTDAGDRYGRADALWGLAEVHRLRNEYSQAMAFHSDALIIFTDIGDRYSRAFALRGIGDAHRDQGDHSSALHHYEQAAEIFKQTGNTRDEAIALDRAAGVRRLMEQRVG